MTVERKSTCYWAWSGVIKEYREDEEEEVFDSYVGEWCGVEEREWDMRIRNAAAGMEPK